MRVIGGTYGGRRLRSMEGRATRPTSDRVREALFSRIEARYGLSGAAVLDVFAGTGALAIEALSRGARRAVCIELERRALDTLRGNLRDLELDQQVRVIGDDYRKVLARLAGERGSPASRGSAAAAPRQPDPPARSVRKRFDGVFIDPPYGKGLAIEALAAIAELGLVKFGGWVTMEVGRREQVPGIVPGREGSLRLVREDEYGDTKLALYEAAGPVTPGEHAEGESRPTAEVEP